MVFLGLKSGIRRVRNCVAEQALHFEYWHHPLCVSLTVGYADFIYVPVCHLSGIYNATITKHKHNTNIHELHTLLYPRLARHNAILSFLAIVQLYDRSIILRLNNVIIITISAMARSLTRMM